MLQHSQHDLHVCVLEDVSETLEESPADVFTSLDQGERKTTVMLTGPRNFTLPIIT